MTINSWKPDTPEIVNHSVLKAYIQDTAAKEGIDAVTLYNTRVENAIKQGEKWRIETTTLSNSESGKLAKIARTWVSLTPRNKGFNELTYIRNLTILLLQQGITTPAASLIFQD